jgi:hypothetical protein
MNGWSAPAATTDPATELYRINSVPHMLAGRIFVF